MAQGDILARLKLDKKAYSAALKEALAEGKAFSASLGADAKLTLPEVPKLKGLPENTAELARQREEVRQSLTALKDFNIALREGDLSQEGFIQAARGVQTQLEKDRAQVDLSSKAYGVYTNAINQVSGKVAQVSAAQATSVATQDRAAKAADKTAQAQVRLGQALRVDQVRQYRDELARLNAVYEKDRDRVKYVRDVDALTREMTEFRATLAPASREIGGLDRALGQATRNLNTVQGKISGLGISQQIAVGLNNQFSQSLASTGRLGQVGALGISAYGGAMTASGLGAAALGAGVLGVGVTTAALVQRGIPQIKSYQQSINILASAGEKDLGRFRGELTNLQEEGGRAAQAFSRSQLAGALAETVKAGVDANDALTLLKTGTQLASAEQEDLAQSTALVLKNVRQFNLDVSEAGRVGDALAQSGLLAADSARDLSEGLSTVGPVAAAAGLSIEETLGLLTNLSNKGLDAAQEGATGLRSVLAQLAKPSKSAQDAIAGLGVSLVKTDGSSKGVKQRLFEVRDAIAASGKDLTEFAAIADTRALTALLALDTSTDDYTQKILAANGALVKFADQQANGLTPAQNRAKAAMDDLASTAAEVFAPAITKGADAVAGLLRNLDGVRDFEFPTAGKVQDFLVSAGDAEQVETATRDLEIARASLQSLREEREKLAAFPVTENKRNGLAGFFTEIIQTDQQDLDRQLEVQDRQISAFEKSVKDRQARLEALTGGGTTGGGRGNDPDPEPRNIIPEVSADYDKGVQEYIDALTSAEDRAAQARIGAMKNGAAKIQAQRDLDLDLALRAFDAQVAGLIENSERYNGFLAAYDTEAAAIRARATTDLQREAEARLREVQSLLSDIDKLKSDVATADAEASGNIVAAITARSAQASKQLEQERQTMLARVEGDTEESRAQILSINASYDDRERQLGEQLTRDLTTEAQRRAATLQSIAERTASIQAQTKAARQRDNGNDTGAIQTELNTRLAEIQSGLDRELAAEGRSQQEITALHRQANAERVSAREDAARQTETIVKDEAEAAKAVLEASSKSLQQAELAGVEGTIPRLRANFEAEQGERRANNAKTLEGFTGSSQDRSRLIREQGQLETILTRQNQLEVNRAANEGQKAYAQGVRDSNSQVAEAQKDARQQEIANLQAFLGAKRAAAEGQTASSDPATQAAGYAALIAVQRDAVRIAKELTQATRERGASASEIVTALSAEAEAQRGVTGALESQIDALKSLRDEQQQVITNGSAVLEYARNAAEISGQSLDYDSAGDAIQAEERAQYDLLQAAIAANAPFEERAELLNQLVQTQQTLNDLGKSTGLTSEERQLIGEQGAAQLDAYPAQAAEALNQIKSLDDQIADLGGTLKAATGELQTLLEVAGSDEGLNVAVKVEIDRGALDAAEQTLRETFGDAAGNRIVEASTNAGTRAGAGLIGAFTSGITRNGGGLLAEVDRLLQQVRDRLPSSDARTGPLSDLTYSGGKLVTTFGAGMLGKRSSLASTASLIAATARPAFTVPTIPTTRALPPSMGAMASGAGGPTIGTLNVDARPAVTPGIYGVSAQQFARDSVEQAKRIVRSRR